MQVQTNPPVQPLSYENTDTRPSWSPDGTKVAAELGRDSVIINRDHEVLAQLGPEDKWVGQPNFSPDGETIAYAVYTTPEGKPLPSWGVYVADVEGGEGKALTHNGRRPMFSPDGEHIAFTGYHNPRKDAVAVMDSNGFNEKVVGKPGAFQDHLSWDPKGQQIVYENATEDGPQLRITDISGDKDRLLTDGEVGAYWDRYPEWSPDGSKVVFERHNRRFPLSELWVVDVATGEDKQLYNPLGRALDPVWSPDGSKVAFVANENGGLDLDLYVIDADGKNLKRLTQTEDQVEHAPSWSPDGDSIAYLTYERDNREAPFAVHILDLE